MFTREARKEYKNADIRIALSFWPQAADVPDAFDAARAQYNIWQGHVISGAESGFAEGVITLSMIWGVFEPLASSLASSAVWDGLKALIAKYKDVRRQGSLPLSEFEPRVEFKVQTLEGLKVTAAVVSHDEAILQQALALLGDVIATTAEHRLRSSSDDIHMRYDHNSRRWIHKP